MDILLHECTCLMIQLSCGKVSAWCADTNLRQERLNCSYTPLCSSHVQRRITDSTYAVHISIVLHQ